MNFHAHKQQLMKSLAFRKAYGASELEYQIARILIKARIKRGYTQKQLADKLRTKQSVISRAENAKTMPSLAFLKRAADAMDVSLEIQMK